MERVILRIKFQQNEERQLQIMELEYSQTKIIENRKWLK